MINNGTRDSGLGTRKSFASSAFQTLLAEALSGECCAMSLVRHEHEIELAGAP
jgi:hypothetical protein